MNPVVPHGTLDTPRSQTVAPGVLPDHEIRRLCQGLDPMITPYHEGPCPEGLVSYGLSHYGYDLRLGSSYRVFSSPLKMFGKGWVDPKCADWHAGMTTLNGVTAGEAVVIPANSFLLAESLEEINVPRDVVCLCLGKSTYARCGIIVNVTPLEPEWRGRVTIEVSNTTPLPAKIYAGEGIAQVLFFRAAAPCETSYADKKGKYQNQTGLTMPKV